MNRDPFAAADRKGRQSIASRRSFNAEAARATVRMMEQSYGAVGGHGMGASLLKDEYPRQYAMLVAALKLFDS